LGAVYVYLGPTNWALSQVLNAADSVGKSQQGKSVAISADQGTIAVGGPYDNNSRGAVWIWGLTGKQYVQEGSKLVGTGATINAVQGWAVALSSDGSTLAAGAPYDAPTQVGSTFIWVRNTSATPQWSQQGPKLVGTGYVGTDTPVFQGWQVSLSADGNTVATGGSRDNKGIGAVWIFTRNGVTWSQQGSKLVGSNYIGYSLQGYSVSLSSDASTLAIGGPGDGQNLGATWVWLRSGSTYVQTQKIIASNSVGTNVNQGSGVSFSNNGGVLAIGGAEDNNFNGATWIFIRNGNQWAQQAKLYGTGGVAGPSQGYAVALDGPGVTLITAGFADADDIGAEWVFVNS